MDFNGHLKVVGSTNYPTLSSVADSSAAGPNATHKKGVLKFHGGFKLQWDTISAGANTTTAFTLPEAYTEEHYTVVGSFAEDATDSAAESTLEFYVPTASKLSTVKCKNASPSARVVTYISFGKDSE